MTITKTMREVGDYLAQRQQFRVKIVKKSQDNGVV